MRTHNDWAALRKAEREGREQPGTFDRLWNEEQAQILAEKNKKAEVSLAEAARLHKEIMR